jgi:hypothetical protein
MINLVIHIGQHKTGSKAIQTALYANPDYLIQHGYLYTLPTQHATQPRPYEMNHHALFHLLRKQVDHPDDRSHTVALVNYLKLLLNHSTPDKKTMIVSAEDLFDMHTAHERAFVLNRVEQGCRILAEGLSKVGFTVKIVCFLRSQDELLASHYAQFIKGISRGFLSFDEFTKTFRGRLDYNAILSIWESHFGVRNIQVVAYCKQTTQRSSVSVFFDSVLGLKPPPIVEPYPNDLEAYNISPSRAYLEYLRVINKHYHEGFKVVHPIDVLEYAFKRDSKQRTGIAAWYSPVETQLFLQPFEVGNQHIALRYQLGDTLFKHVSHTDQSKWKAYDEPNIGWWIDLDTQAKRYHDARLNASHSLRSFPHGWKKRRYTWLIVDKKVENQPKEVMEHLISKLGYPGEGVEIQHHIPVYRYPELLWSVKTLLIVGKDPHARLERLISWILRQFGIKSHWI